MAKSRLSRGEFRELYEAVGPVEMTRRTGLALQNVNQRRQRIEKDTGVKIVGPGKVRDDNRIQPPKANGRIEISVKDGHVIVFSDAHYYPGEKTLMHRALVHLIKDLKPKILIANGDILDLPQASRHASIGWESRPTIANEIEFAQECMHEIAMAAGKGVQRIWSMGNHDIRFETRIANVAPEYALIHGVHLSDHFPDWQHTWSTFINGDVLVKHRFRSGVHAVHNNILWAGLNIVTGHLHSAQVRPLTFYDERTIWGMDTGCLAEPTAAAFVNYTEANPSQFRSAFGVLTFKGGRLMQPELVLKWSDTEAQWRGKTFKP